MAKKIIDVVVAAAMILLMERLVKAWGDHRYKKGVEDTTDVIAEMLDYVAEDLGKMDQEELKNLTENELRTLAKRAAEKVERRRKK